MGRHIRLAILDLKISIFRLHIRNQRPSKPTEILLQLKNSVLKNVRREGLLNR